uniref:Uncharacterized protein n=1 Tax=Cajanus cajan TaxID=3821 RepID=A0A151R5Q1_CAJCA|nr:hypothetical protein KK1_040912 [Cajanus cajan]
MLLNPEDADFFDLLGVLFSRKLGNRRFVECDAEGAVEGSFRHRWLIFVSVVLQKFLMYVAKPLAFFGSCIELLINLLLLNGGFFRIFINFLTCNYLSFLPTHIRTSYFFFFNTLLLYTYLTQNPIQHNHKKNISLS